MGALVVMLCGVPEAQAQTGSARPYRGLFGGAGADAAARQSLNLSISVIEVYDDNLRADVASVTPTNTRAGGFYTSLTPNLDFASRGRNVQVSATTSSNLRYYGEQNRLISIGHSMAARVSVVAMATCISGWSFEGTSVFGVEAAG